MRGVTDSIFKFCERKLAPTPSVLVGQKEFPWLLQYSFCITYIQRFITKSCTVGHLIVSSRCVGTVGVNEDPRALSGKEVTTAGISIPQRNKWGPGEWTSGTSWKNNCERVCHTFRWPGNDQIIWSEISYRNLQQGISCCWMLNVRYIAQIIILIYLHLCNGDPVSNDSVDGKWT